VCVPVAQAPFADWINFGSYVGKNRCGGRDLADGESCDYSVKPESTSQALARQHDMDCGGGVDEWGYAKSPARTCRADADRRFVAAAHRSGNILSIGASYAAQVYNYMVRDAVDAWLEGAGPMPDLNRYAASQSVESHTSALWDGLGPSVQDRHSHTPTSSVAISTTSPRHSHHVDYGHGVGHDIDGGMNGYIANDGAMGSYGGVAHNFGDGMRGFVANDGVMGQFNW